MVRKTASKNKQQKGHDLAMAADRFPSCPSSSSGSPRTPLALRTHRSRSAPSAHCSASSAPAPKELPGDPPGDGIYLRGVGLRPSRANRRHSPRTSIVPLEENKEEDETRCVDESMAVDVLDYLPMEVRKVMTNMQQYYAEGMEVMNEEMRLLKEENEELKRRLDMHFVMLRQANQFMQSVRNGSFRGVERADVPMLAEEKNEKEDDVRMGGVDMGLPPTPVVDRKPVRSAGRKVARRRPGGRDFGQRRRKKRKTKMERVSTEASAAHPKDSSDAVGLHLTEAPRGVETLQEEKKPQESGRGHDEDGAEKGVEDDDNLKILAGAPRLQAVLRRSAWTAVNDHWNETDPNADYRPCSPSSAPSDTDSDSDWAPPSPPAPPAASVWPPRTPTRSKTAAAPTQSSTPSSKSPRYSTPRHTTIRRYASGPNGRPFRFHRMGRTVLDVWTEYKHGWKGNPAIEALEREFATGWRTGTLQEVKYASNYVGVRQKVVNQVEEICEREGITPEEACRRLDERVDGRMQMLITAVRKGEDPFEVIPKR